MMDDALLVHRAARGDGEAQDALARAILERGYACEISREDAVTAAEVYARLAASHGTNSGMTLLGGVLFKRAEVAEYNGDTELAIACTVEGVRCLDQLADAGDEPAAELLAAYAPFLRPEVMALATSRLPLDRKE